MKLYVTYCSAEKRQGIHRPDQLYLSNRINYFIKKCKTANLDWAIFSALHGFFFPDQEKNAYNVTLRTNKKYWLGITVVEDEEKLPQDQSKEQIAHLAATLQQQAKNRDIDYLIFYAPSPKMMKCYLAVLHYAFDRCTKPHGWQDLLQHVKNTSGMIRVVHKMDLIS